MKLSLILSLCFLSLMSYAAASASTPLEGVWLRQCSKGGMQVQIFEGNSSRTTELFFEDSNCYDPLMAFLNDGQIKIQNQQIDFQFEKVSVVLYSDKIIEDFNRRSVCGKNDWGKNDVTPVTGQICAFFQESKLVQVPKAGEMRFGIWKKELNKLYFGMLTQAENGTTPEKRPTSLDPRAYFKQR